jgi:hypothetical protein
LSVLFGALIVSAAIVAAGALIAKAVREPRRRGMDDGRAELLALFAPGIEAAQRDPRALLTWQPLAVIARKLFPSAFAALDTAAGGTFPFTTDQIQAAHARWSADWLTWERAHDAEYKLKAAAAHDALGDREATPFGRSQLEAIEREKLERYQQRYAEYSRVSRGLQSLLQQPPGAAAPGPVHRTS